MTDKSSTAALGDAAAVQLDVWEKISAKKCTTVCPSTSITKRYIVALLAACFECSPALAVWLGRVALWAWPNMQRA
jgi:hypothetical protein